MSGKYMNIQVYPEFREALRDVAAKHEMTLSAYVNRLFGRHLKVAAATKGRKPSGYDTPAARAASITRQKRKAARSARKAA